MGDNFSTLVIGCKKHEQVAESFFLLTNKNWPELLSNLFFCTDEISDFQKEFAKDKLCLEVSLGYSDRIINGLKKVPSDYVLLLLDDYFFPKTVDNRKVEAIVDSLKENDIDYCKLIGLPMCYKRYKNINHAFCIKGKTHYGVSLQPSIWKKSALLDALSCCSGSNAWEVEGTFALFQQTNHEKCISFNKNILSIKNGVIRGKVTPGTNRLLRKNGITELNLDKMSWIKYRSFMIKQHIAMHLPTWMRATGKKIGRLFGKKYYSEK